MSEKISDSSKVLYVSGSLPALSETFVYNEIFCLEAKGQEVHTASVHPSDWSLSEPRFVELADRTVQIYGLGKLKLLGDAAHAAFAKPLKTISIMALAACDSIFERDVQLSRRPKILWQAVAGLALAWRVRDEKIRHIHAHMAHVPTTIAMYAAKWLEVPFSFVGHAIDIFALRSLLTAKLRRAAFVSCISEFHRAYYKEQLVISEDKLPLIRCGVDLEKLPQAEIGEPRAPLKILSVGRLVEKKGFDLLIRALSEIKSETGYHCTIIGEGEERGRLVTLIEESGLADRITLAGVIDNQSVLHTMANSDLFVLPCRVTASGDRDGIPVVLMEAMAIGLPTIAGNLPTINELIEDGSTGYLVSTSDHLELSQRLQSLLDSNDLRRRFGAAGREKVMRDFSLDRHVQRLLEFLNKSIPSDTKH